MVALFGGADVVTSGFSAGEPYPPRLHVKPPSNKLSMLYHHTKVRIPINWSLAKNSYKNYQFKEGFFFGTANMYY
ncbi:hypothetical protein QPM05_13570 [Caldibacillus thermoamylovorans]|nr:hypothetical protein [Caldibacillus thermoamylovorans]